MKRSNWPFTLRLLLVVLIFSTSWACNRGHYLARVESRQGDVQRNLAKEGKDWSIADIGTTFEVGDALRTAKSSSAILGLEGGGKLNVREGTIIRFQNRRPSAKNHDFNVETGQVLLEAGSEELRVVTNIGLARFEANSKVLIRRIAERLEFDVTLGKARFESEQETRTINEGQSYIIGVGNAVLETLHEPNVGSVTSNHTPPEDAGTAPADIVAGSVSAVVKGNGATQKGPTEQAFQNLPQGATRLLPGVTLRLESGSSVHLEHGGVTASLSGAGSYKIRADREGLVEVQSGTMSVNGVTRIIVPGGVIETVDNSAATLETLGMHRTRVRVAQGTATVIDGQTSTKVSAGEEATLNGDGMTKLDGRGLAYADVTVIAGESFIVHDPKPPTAIRFMFDSRCNAGGTIRVRPSSGRQFASGKNSATLSFDQGRKDYELYCLTSHGLDETPIARGTATVLRDAGTRPVPTKPPSTTVQLDGHNYTIMYQNQLPSVTVVWPNAPSATSFTLHVESGGGTKSYSMTTPSYSFKSGALLEGLHTFYFEGGNKTSRHTGVKIAFDNAAPTASLVTPVNPVTDASGNLTIAGVAQPGWVVEIGGDKIAQDGQQRFNHRVQARTEDRAVTVKLIHPTRGVHIYLRRTAGSNE
jgi:hypothetical protein